LLPADRFKSGQPDPLIHSSINPIIDSVPNLPRPRPAATQTTTKSDAYSILASQRLHRPVSPHLGIYRPQVTSVLSALNRVTGSILSGGFYLFGAAYLVSPLFGWHLDTASMAAVFASMPLAAKVPLKMLVAFPFTFHSFNGVRHLIWDVGFQLKNQQVINTGWTVVGLSVVSALGLAFI
jgi:succinate dehydrogenase (ubiquinone) cytochrome b560 subunit